MELTYIPELYGGWRHLFLGNFKLNLEIFKKVYSGTTVTCANDVLSYIESASSKKCWLACLNPHSYIVSKKDRVFFNALNNADFLIADGIGIIGGMKCLGFDISNRITGPEFFYETMYLLNNLEKSYRIFFLGSSRKVLDMVEQNFKNDYKNLVFAGSYSPPFEDNFSDDVEKFISVKINSSNVDILWVGMTAPKQEKWINKNMQHLDIKFAGAIGAVFDFYAGANRRAPFIFRKFGLEWFFRLLLEPKRLWKRTFVSSTSFIFDILINLFSRKSRKWF
jgi:N-acetylglucosaminyldiphosphoundecaprenol N-acetyl-beta-D-mannosaminyltransferase